MGKGEMRASTLLLLFRATIGTNEPDWRVWRGNDFIGKWTAYGGNRQSFEEPYDLREYSNMFDGNPKTFWHGDMEPTETNRVAVNFTDTIEFKRLVIKTRPDQIYDQSRYQNICLFVDGELDE